MQAVKLDGYIDIPHDRIEQVQDQVSLFVVHSRAEPGCLYFNIHACQTVENRLMMTAKFKDQAAVEAHFKTKRNCDFLKSTTGIPRIYEVSYE